MIGQAIVEKVMRRVGPTVAEKLEATRARLTKLEADRGRLALAVELNEPGAATKLATLNKDAQLVREQVAQLAAAFEVAQRRDRASEARQDAEVQREQFARLERVANAREQAADRLCQALADAAAAYGDFLQMSELMMQALPTGCQWPPAWASHLTPGLPLVANEMWRHSKVKQVGERGAALPGAEPLTQLNRFQPEHIAPMSQAIAESNDYLLAAVRRQIEIAEQVANEMARAA